MNIKRNIIFCLESRKQNSIPIVDNVPIRMRVTYASNRVEFTTGYRIDVAKWDETKQRVKNGCSNKLKQTASDINADLNDYYTTLQTIFKEYEVQDTVPTPKQLKETFTTRSKDASSPTKKNTLFSVFNEFIAECSKQNNWTTSTITKFNTVKKHLEDFDNKLTFAGFDDERLSNYVDFLREVKGMRNSTISKQIGYLKWFLRWAFRKGYSDNRDFDGFKPKLKTTQKKVIFLTDKELQQLTDYTIPPTKQYLERVRDVFLFTCYSGLRYSDAYNLKRSDIKDNHIEITTIKTADSLKIDLNDYSRAVLNKYEDVHFENDKALPVISNQKMNDYLKELCKLAEIDEPVSETYYKGNERIETTTPKHELIGTHTGRKTFICKALSLGIPVQVVMKWTGHSDYKAMKPYIDVADEVKASAMSKFNKSLKK